MGFYADRIFPFVLDATEPPELGDLRRRTVAGVKGKILEVGFGTGTMLPFYPSNVTRLDAVEPSGGMQKRAAKRIKEWGGTFETAELVGDKLPYEDNRFDSVVMSMVLCSASEPESVLAEILRVLKPEGRYHFLEHVASREEKALKWQKRLDGFHQAVACGCSLTLNSLTTIQNAGFEIEQCSSPETMPGVSQVIYPYILGVARPGGAGRY